MMLLLALLLVTVGSGISLLYIYTGGHLDHDSIERALPVLKRDVDHSFALVAQKAEFLLYETQQAVAPLWKKVCCSKSFLVELGCIRKGIFIIFI